MDQNILYTLCKKTFIYFYRKYSFKERVKTTRFVSLSHVYTAKMNVSLCDSIYIQRADDADHAKLKTNNTNMPLFNTICKIY